MSKTRSQRSQEAAERAIAEQKAKLEQLRCRDAVVASLETALRAAKRNDFANARANAFHATAVLKPLSDAQLAQLRAKGEVVPEPEPTQLSTDFEV